MKTSFTCEDKEFVVDCNMFSAKEVVYVNGKVLSQKKNFLKLKSAHIFEYEGESYELRMQFRFLQGVFNVTLLKRGQEVYDQDFSMQGKAFATKKVLIPKWSYIFVVLCGIIPFVSLGGALPVLLGMGGAGICISTAMPTLVRIVLSSVVTVMVWVLFIFLIAAIRSFQKA